MLSFSRSFSSRIWRPILCAMKKNTFCLILILFTLFKIPPNAPYVLSGLNTEHPVLIIDDKLKLIGEYQETVGTCLIFKEVASPVVHVESGPSEANFFAGKCIMDPNHSPSKEVKPVTSLQRIIKFRLAPNLDFHDTFEMTQ